MKKIVIFIITVLFVVLFSPINIKALTKDEYQQRHLCSNYELARANSDKSATKINCYDSFDQARSAMNNSGESNLIIFDERSTTRIIDAKEALVDLTVTPNTYADFYESSSLNTRIYTSINPNSSYSGADAAYISINPANYAAEVKVAGFKGWVASENYVIVPLTWVVNSTSYLIDNESISHRYVNSIQTASSIYSRSLGPKPDSINQGTYYSYDGHYFYSSLSKMLTDYKNNNYNNAVNKNNPYYNYYMYLSNHTKTTYSSLNIDEYTRNVLGYTYNAYGDTSKSGASRLYGAGTYFYNAQQVYGVNALLSYSLSRNETGNGTSSLAINKNNGFGLNAVDASPTESAKYYASFSASILGYASKWNTYGYSYATDWRYFGPSFGDKYIGMNVKYATDAYWSEKMASFYYSFDKYYGLNDYNYYQLGMTNKPTNAYFYSNGTKVIYEYPEASDGVVIVGEVGNYYKVISDMNIDSNGNLVGSKYDYTKPYNWNTNYVYVNKNDINKINTGKNGYIDPSSVTNYKDSNYTYELYIEDTVLKPKVAKLKEAADYYYDSTLTSKTGKRVLKDKYVMVYEAAYNGKGEITSYLITSDYKFDQKHWVDKSKIKFITSGYGKQILDKAGYYELVCSEPIDRSEYYISRQYTNSYIPLLSSRVVDGVLWYQVPVSLDSNENSTGWLLAVDADARIEFYWSAATNNEPVISAQDKSIVQGNSFNPLEGISATDNEDGDLTNKITVNGTVDTNKVGSYQITYTVSDKEGLTTNKTVTITVIRNEEPKIEATDKEVTIGHSYNPLDDVKATDKEDGNITNKIKVVKNTVNINELGDYEVEYEVVDSYNQKATKKITVSVVPDSKPEITVTDKVITLGSNFDSLKDVKATDKEDGDITEKIKVDGSVDTSTIGIYEIEYSVTDSYGNKSTKRIKVEVREKVLEEKKGTFYLHYLKEENKKLVVLGYQTITGINNTLDNNIDYELVFENIDTKEEKIFTAKRVTDKKQIPKKVYSPDGFDYTYSWFKKEINIDELDYANYKVYVVAKSDDYYSKNILFNKVNNEQATKVQGENNSAIISNNYTTSTSYIEIMIRKDILTNKSSSYIYNQYEKFTKFEFNNDKLHLSGNSYSYGMDLSEKASVNRKIVFENKETYKTYTKDLGSTTNNKKVSLPVNDNLDKSKAWYDANIDISDLPKGEYVIYIITEANISDISEMREKLGRSLDDVKRTINEKDYSFTINSKRGNRIELIIK